MGLTNSKPKKKKGSKSLGEKKADSNFGKDPKLNKKDYIFKSIKGETVSKLPGYE